MDKNAIELLVELVHPDIEPDLTIFLDLPVDLGGPFGVDFRPVLGSGRDPFCM